MRKKKKKRYVVRQRGRAALRISMLLGALLLVAGLIFGAVKLISRLVKGMGKGMDPLPFASDANYTFTGSGFLYFAEDKLCYDDIADKKKDTSYRINTQELNLAASPTVSALYHDTAVQIVGAEDSLVFSGRVLMVACGNGHVAVLREDSAGSTAIVIYDANGIQTDQMDFDAHNLMSFGFSNAGGDTLWTLEADLNTPTPVSTLTTYNLDSKRTTGVMAVHGQLVEDVIFTNSSAFLCSTTHMIRYATAGSSEAYRTSVYGWELSDYCLSGSSPLMLYSQRGEAGGALRIYSVSEGEVASAAAAVVNLPEGALGAYLVNGKLLVFTPTEVHTYSSAGKLQSTEELNMEISAAEKLSDSHVLLTEGNSLYLYAVE